METTQQNNDEIEIDLLELLHVLWSKALVIFLTAAAAGLAVMLVTQLFLTPDISRLTKMYILTKQNSDTLTSSDLQASEQLTQDCAQMIRSRQVAEAVISNLNLDMKASELLEKISVETSTTRGSSRSMRRTAIRIWPAASPIRSEILRRMRFRTL